MERLKELVDVINRNKVKMIEVVGSPPPRQTKVQQLYELVSSGEVQEDAEAALLLYGTDSDNRNYKELKSRLISRLYNTAFFIDVQQPKYDNMSKAYYSCWKDFATAKILMGKEAILNGRELLEKTLRKSRKYDLTEITIDITRQLRIYYATVRFDLKKYNYYNDLYYKYSKQLEIEALAEEYYSQTLIRLYRVGGTDMKTLNKDICGYLRELAPHLEKYDTYRLHLCYHLIRLLKATNNNNTEEAIDICEFALDFFASNKKYPSSAVGIFSRRLFLFLWQDRKYEKAKRLLEQGKKYSRVGGIGWFINHYYFALLCMHDERYQEAYETFQYVINHQRFPQLPDHYQERWKVMEAYLYYLVSIGKIKSKDKKRFKISKFLNEVPIFSKDKRGRNIPILIIHILLLLSEKKHTEVLDRMEAIDKYRTRHVKNDKTIRSNYFIKMLLKIVDSNFHRQRAEHRAANSKAKLEEVPFEVATKTYDTEIIPYEILWEMALNSLGR